MTCEFPWTTGLSVMPGTSRRISAASSSLSVDALPAPPWTAPRLLAGEIVRTFVPSVDSRDRTWALEPSPSETIAITEATPMMMPSVVRALRPLFARSASNADGTLCSRRPPARPRGRAVVSAPDVARGRAGCPPTAAG